jgi:hypothetical protein
MVNKRFPIGPERFYALATGRAKASGSSVVFLICSIAKAEDTSRSRFG